MMSALLRPGRRPRLRLFCALSVSMVTATVAVLLFVIPAAAGGKDDDGDGLRAFVVANNKGPLPACAQDQSNCTAANAVTHFVHVRNKLELSKGGPSRVLVPDAFVINGIDEHVFVDGVDTFDFVELPPPDTNHPAFAGHWPATVVCSPAGPPCNQVTGPAVLPGENVAVFYTGWVHGDAEPNGTYVFTFVVHGTVNGEQRDLTANSRPILMTS
jgi:hypothetical protein